MFSQTAEYALRAMVWIANQSDRFVSSNEIAQAASVPTDYLLKILQTLGQAGFLERKRGLNGGFKLARLPAEITILEIVNIFDPIRRIEKCPLGMHPKALCPLHKKLDTIVGELQCLLSSTSLKDLIHQESPLCK